MVGLLKSFTNKKEPIAITDDQGKTLGLEEPLKDDPIIRIKSKKLFSNKGKAFINPKDYGGSMIDQVSTNLGEPLNVIISSLSSKEILTRSGFQSYLRSLNFDKECLGLHSGTPQKAFIDPRGFINQDFEFRQIYNPLDHIFGTCIESLLGGNHLRAWQQQGTAAWFLAVSKEENISKGHTIVPNGYDIGRNDLILNAKIGKSTSFMFKNYQTSVEYVSNLLPIGSKGINHNISIDGKVAILTVKIIKK